MSDPPLNPLVSDQPSSGGFKVALHPLVLLSVSDYITRHTLREQAGPVFGALLGRQNGGEISLQYAFEVKLAPSPTGTVIMDEQWLDDRLEQYKMVHKTSPVDLVGWFTIAPSSGPQIEHLEIHRQVLSMFDSAVLLAFHSDFSKEKLIEGGSLPLTLWDSVREANGQGEMVLDPDGEPIDLRFRKLAYTVETDEAEMIAVNYVAKGGPNATAGGTESEMEAPEREEGDQGKGKQLEVAASKDKTRAADSDDALLPEERELIATLTAKANAIKMLQSRIQLIQTYLANLLPSYLSEASHTMHPDAPSPTSQPPIMGQPTEINHPILRSIQGLVSRLQSLVPANRAEFEAELAMQRNDVLLVALLGAMGSSIDSLREAGRKHMV
ncbi:MAG: THO complex subunit 2 [Watsoniomyces obsoletus]|nr:MAG: THO complex subunit 2 [Watsoniomyces obsoletus]